VSTVNTFGVSYDCTFGFWTGLDVEFGVVTNARVSVCYNN